eukprot:6173994-Pleurochrysis_carterae.AAC.1
MRNIELATRSQEASDPASLPYSMTGHGCSACDNTENTSAESMPVAPKSISVYQFGTRRSAACAGMSSRNIQQRLAITIKLQSFQQCMAIMTRRQHTL